MHCPAPFTTKHKKSTDSHHCEGVLTLSWLNLVTFDWKEALCRSCGKQMKAPHTDSAALRAVLHTHPPVTSPEVLRSI